MEVHETECFEELINRKTETAIHRLKSLQNRVIQLRRNAETKGDTELVALIDLCVEWSQRESFTPENSAILCMPWESPECAENTELFLGRFLDFFHYLQNPWSGVLWNEREHKFCLPNGIDARSIHKPSEVLEILLRDRDYLKTHTNFAEG